MTGFHQTIAVEDYPHHTEPQRIPSESTRSNAPGIKAWIEMVKKRYGRDFTVLPKIPAPEKGKLIRGALRPALEVYASNAVKHATVENLEDGTYYAEVSDLSGVWSNAGSKEDALQELKETIIEWLEMKVEDEDDDIPVLNNLNLGALARYISSQTTLT